MMDEEEKRIKVLELKHQELMTLINTEAVIFFAIFVIAFVFIFNAVREKMMPNIRAGVIILLVLILFYFGAITTWDKIFKKKLDSAKNIRDQIFKLE